MIQCASCGHNNSASSFNLVTEKVSMHYLFFFHSSCRLINMIVKVDNGCTQYALKTAVFLISVNSLLKAKTLRAVAVNSSVYLNASA